MRIRLRDAMAALITKMPSLGGLTVFDARGRFVVSNISATTGWTSVRDRTFFQYQASGP
jgi:hypothetical protein